jgi:hypothetical protein
MNNEKSDPLEDLEKKLNSPKQFDNFTNRKSLGAEVYETPRDWDSPHVDTQKSSFALKFKKTNWFVQFFIWATLFALFAVVYVGIRYYLERGIGVGNVDILVNAPLTIGSGEQFDFETTMQNKNQVAIKNIDVEVTFPEGTRSVQNIETGYEIDSQKIENLDSGAIFKQNYSAYLFGEEGERKKVTIAVTYQIDGSDAFFKKEKVFDVVLKSTPVRTIITNLKELTSGQDMIFDIEIISNSTQTLKNVIVQAVYPFGFTYKNSTLDVEADKKTWIIPTLEPKQNVKFTIKGTLSGQNKDQKFFNFSTGLEDGTTGNPQIVFSKKGTTVTITRPFFEIDLAINESNSDIIVIGPTKAEDGLISFKNNTNFPLRNVSVSLKMKGDLLNKYSVTVEDGFYQSVNNTISWDNTTNDQLYSIPVGAYGSLSFNFNTLSPTGSLFVQNPEMLFTMEAMGNRNPEDQVPEFIKNTIAKKIRFNTETSLEAKSEHYTQTFVNTGPIPPKAERKTTYTVVFNLKNTTNQVNEAIVSMKIPNYVQYEGAFLPSNEDVSYDAISRTLLWNAGTLAPKTGMSGGSIRKMAIQVSIVPSISQGGDSPDLVNNIMYTGVDAFTQSEIKQQLDPVTTEIRDGKQSYSGQVSR